jgi:hypothetical protein
MDDLTPVKGPAPPFEGRSAKVLGLVVIALLVALIKPWGTGPAPVARTAVPSATATAVVVAASPTPFDPFANYDHEIFGVYEPAPRWELWPAGYLVTFGYAIRIESGPSTAPETTVGQHPIPSSPPASGVPASGAPAPSPSAPSSSAPTPAASGAPASPAPSADLGPEPLWPSTIRITSGNHLAFLGVNMPLGYRVTGIGLTRMTDTGDEAVDTITPASDWPSHFTIIAVADEARKALDRWPPGRYRLVLAFEPDHITRTIEIDIDPTPDDVPAASPTPGPS